MRPLVRVATAAGWLAVVLFATSGGSAASRAPAAADGAAARPASARDQVLLHDAEQVLIQRCMRSEGFRYWRERSPEPAEMRSFGYVLDDVSWAREHGYGGKFDRAAQAAQRDNPNRAYVRELSEDRRRALDGALWGSRTDGVLSVKLPTGPIVHRSTTGCQAQAQRALYGDLARWFRASAVFDTLTGLYADDVAEDPRLRRAERDWSACMRRSGQAYASPGEIRAALPRLTRGLTPERSDALEIRLAVAEARCARGSPLARVATSLEREYGGTVRGRYRESVETTWRMQRIALVRARDVVGTDH